MTNFVRVSIGGKINDVPAYYIHFYEPDSNQDDPLIVSLLVQGNTDLIPLVYHPGQDQGNGHLRNVLSATSSAASILYEFINNPGLKKTSKYMWVIPMPAPLKVAISTASVIYNVAQGKSTFEAESPTLEGYFDVRDKALKAPVIFGSMRKSSVIVR